MEDQQEDMSLSISQTPEEKFEAKKAWKKLKNVLTASFLLKTQDAHVVADVNELLEEVRMSPTKINMTRGTTITSEVIFDHRATDKLFFHIKRSSQEDLLEIDKMIENNPRRYTRNRNDPDSFVNKQNMNGIRPLYEACKNGYSNTVQLLLDHGADPHLLSDLDKKDQESCLEVACRWNHVQVIRLLLNKTSWNNKEIKDALKKCDNPGSCEVFKTLFPSNRASCGCVVS